MGTMLENSVSEDVASPLEPAEIECAVCGMPSLNVPTQHYLDCPRHDSETCHVCSAP